MIFVAGCVVSPSVVRFIRDGFRRIVWKWEVVVDRWYEERRFAMFTRYTWWNVSSETFRSSQRWMDAHRQVGHRFTLCFSFLHYFFIMIHNLALKNLYVDEIVIFQQILIIPLIVHCHTRGAAVPLPSWGPRYWLHPSPTWLKNISVSS